MSKITKEELEKLVKQQKELNLLLNNIGVLSSQKHGLLHEIGEINKEVLKDKKELEEKYGSVNINLEDGTYEPIKSKEKEEEEKE
tara:strand:+ start:8785 stop:9039 length:255 start_codon:yes stop_codon:yes gene_type:complete